MHDIEEVLINDYIDDCFNVEHALRQYIKSFLLKKYKKEKDFRPVSVNERKIVCQSIIQYFIEKNVMLRRYVPKLKSKLES